MHHIFITKTVLRSRRSDVVAAVASESKHVPGEWLFKGGMISTQQKFLSLRYPALHSCTESPDWKRGGSHARGLDVVSGSARL
jgi:hypothetical protein